MTGGFGKNPVRVSEVVEEHYYSLLSALEARMKSEAGEEGGKNEKSESEHVPFTILFYIT